MGYSLFGNSKQDFNCMIPIDFQCLQKNGFMASALRELVILTSILNALTAGLKCWLGLITGILQEG